MPAPEVALQGWLKLSGGSSCELALGVQMPQVFLPGWDRSVCGVTGRWGVDEPPAEPQKPAAIPRFQELLLWFASCSLAINAALCSCIQEQRSGDSSLVFGMFIRVFMMFETQDISLLTGMSVGEMAVGVA